MTLDCALDTPQICSKWKENSAQCPHNKGYEHSCTVIELWETTGIFEQSVRFFRHPAEIFWQTVREWNCCPKLSQCWRDWKYFWASSWRQQSAASCTRTCRWPTEKVNTVCQTHDLDIDCITHEKRAHERTSGRMLRAILTLRAVSWMTSSEKFLMASAKYFEVQMVHVDTVLEPICFQHAC